MLSKDKRFHFSAATALKRLGHEDELIELLLNMTKSAVPLGPTGTIAEKPPEHKEKFADLASFKVLTDIFWDSGHQAVIDLIREKIYCDGKGWYWLAALLMLEQVGDPDVAELWRKLSLADLESPQTRFLHNWYAKGLSRNKLTQWINRRLQKPADKLSIKKIVSMPRYHSEDYMWKNDQRDIQSHFHFALFALAASGQGVFTDGDNYNLPTYNDLLVEMVPDYDKDFRITSHSSESKSEYDLKIVINNRLYRYSRSLNVPDWNHSYEVRAAAEMLNTIASRFGNKKRFFVYETGMGYDFRLVLYVEPVVAKELADKFTIIPVESSKLWMLEED
jgi:hypothetical protein